jgi:NAD-dependent deacetylase
MEDLTESVRELARLLEQAHHAVALTGAGVSTESGIPDFRSPESGLWAMVDPLKVASIEGFLSDPVSFYQFWKERFSRLTEAQPNITHLLLARLEAQGLLKAVITQNIDDLHRRAGSKRILEVHGNYTRGLCIECRRPYEIETLFAKVEQEGVPRCDLCEGLLKPDVVLFGEILPPAFAESEAEIHRADLLLVLGSSLEVYPVADLVPQAKYCGARVVLINREPTPLDRLADLVIYSDLGPVMHRLGELLGLS